MLDLNLLIYTSKLTAFNSSQASFLTISYQILNILEALIERFLLGLDYLILPKHFAALLIATTNNY